MDPGGDEAHDDAVDGQLGAGDDEAARAQAGAEDALARQTAAAHVSAVSIGLRPQEEFDSKAHSIESANLIRVTNCLSS